MNRYEDTHLDDGMRHSGLVPSAAEKEEERLRKENNKLRAQVRELMAKVKYLESIKS